MPPTKCTLLHKFNTLLILICLLFLSGIRSSSPYRAPYLSTREPVFTAGALTNDRHHPRVHPRFRPCPLPDPSRLPHLGHPQREWRQRDDYLPRPQWKRRRRGLVRSLVALVSFSYSSAVSLSLPPHFYSISQLGSKVTGSDFGRLPFFFGQRDRER